MNIHTTRNRGPRGQALPLRASVLAAAAVGTALLATACGSGSPAAGSPSQQAALPASQRAATAASIPPARQAQLTRLGQQYTACMRSHGVTNFPDPSPGGGFEFDMHLTDTRSSRFQAAAQACQDIVSKVHKLMHSE